MANEDDSSKKGWRLSILASLEIGALPQGDKTRPLAACRLAFEALDDDDADVATLAVSTFAAIGTEDTYLFLSAELAKLRYASGESAGGRVARRLIEALERMRNPQRASAALAGVLGQRLGASLEPAVLEALERLTAQRFASPQEWVVWTESVGGLTLAEWRQGITNQRVAQKQRYEEECEEIFMSLLAALRDAPDKRLEVLQDGLTRATIPTVRRRAVVELGRMGRKGRDGEQRTRALAVLKSQLPSKGQASPYYDEIQALVILHLGRTGDPALLEDLARFLSVTSPRMRVAAADALGALGAPGATRALVAELRKSGQRSVDSEVTQAVIRALGQIGANDPLPDEELRVSDVLVAHCRKLMASEGEPSGLLVLQLTRSAEALGKLPYGDAKAVGPAVKLLSELLVHGDSKIRFAAATALGPLVHGEVFPVLEVRLRAESEDHIRKAILDAVGLQARSTPGLASSAIRLLVPCLFASDALRPRAIDALNGLVRDDETFEALELLVVALRKDRDSAAALQVAAPFLRQLPGAGELTEAMKPHLDRYYRLLATRAWSLLPTAPSEALADFDAVLEGRGWRSIAVESAVIHLGRGRAKLQLGLPGEAFALSKECLALWLSQKNAPTDRLVDAWTVALDAVAQGKLKRPEATQGMLKQLEPYASKIPDALKARLESLEATK
jgi:HEAT repeat protein